MHGAERSTSGLLDSKNSWRCTKKVTKGRKWNLRLRFRNGNYVSRERDAGNTAWKRRSRRVFVASWSPGNKAEKR